MKKKMLLVSSLVILSILAGNSKSGCQETPRILFDEYHTSVSPMKFAEFLEELEGKGCQIEISQERIDSSILSRDNYDIFVIFGPKELFSEEEKAAIMDFVENGGGLILFGEGGPRMRRLGITNPLNGVSQMFGIEFNEDMVEDEQRMIEGVDQPEQCVISNFRSHPVTKDVESMGFLYGCSLTLNGPGTALAFGAPTTTADGKKGKDVVVLIAVEYGKGKVLAIGDYDFLFVISKGDFLSLYDNRKLGHNMFEWVFTPPVITPPETTAPPTTPPPTTPPPTTPPPTTPPPTTPPPTTPPPEDGICLGTTFLVFLLIVSSGTRED